MSGTNNETEKSVRLATFGIMNTGVAGLDGVLDALQEIDVDIAILTETGLAQKDFSYSYKDYRVVASKAAANKAGEAKGGGVALAWKPNTAKLWFMDGVDTHGQNAVSAVIRSGKHLWTLIGSFVSPEDDLDLCNEALSGILKGAQRQLNKGYILMGNLNILLPHPDDASLGIEPDPSSFRNDAIRGTLTNLGLEDVRAAFPTDKKTNCRNTYNKKTTEDVWLRSPRYAHIVATNTAHFLDTQTHQATKFESDHLILCADLNLAPAQDLTKPRLPQDATAPPGPNRGYGALYRGLTQYVKTNQVLEEHFLDTERSSHRTKRRFLSHLQRSWDNRQNLYANERPNKMRRVFLGLPPIESDTET